MLPDRLTAQVRAWMGDVNGRTVLGVVTDEGVVHADFLPLGQDAGDAALDVIRLLRSHPDLNSIGVDFATNHAPLSTHLSADRSLAGSHVEVVRVAKREALLMEAQRAAYSAASTVPLVAATDGGRDTGNRFNPRSGFGWVTENGARGYGRIQARSALETELVAIERLLEATHPVQPLVVYVDSQAALKLAQAAIERKEPPTATTNATASVLAHIRSHADRPIELAWVKGHLPDEKLHRLMAKPSAVDLARAALLNRAADYLAQLGRTGAEKYAGNDERLEAYADQEAARVVADLGSLEIAQIAS